MSWKGSIAVTTGHTNRSRVCMFVAKNGRNVRFILFSDSILGILSGLGSRVDFVVT